MPGVDNPEEHGIEDGQLRVYIAGPYTGGDWGQNIMRAVNAAQLVYMMGHVPFIPHTMTALWSTHYDNDWIEYDLKWLEACDAMLRLSGESEGADSEEEFANINDIPVYHSIEEFTNEVGEYRE